MSDYFQRATSVAFAVIVAMVPLGSVSAQVTIAAPQPPHSPELLRKAAYNTSQPSSARATSTKLKAEIAKLQQQLGELEMQLLIEKLNSVEN